MPGAAGADEGGFDAVPMITMKHFEAAMRESRRSVNDAKLAEYDNFNREQNMQKQKLSATTGQSLAGFTFPGQEGRGGGRRGRPPPPPRPSSSTPDLLGSSSHRRRGARYGQLLDTAVSSGSVGCAVKCSGAG